MIALDTNVLVRYIVRDEPSQTALATEVVETVCSATSPGIVTVVVLCELLWVLERGYRYRKDALAEVVRRLLSATELEVEHRELAWRALRHYEHGKADYADYVIGLVGRALHAKTTVTFDSDAAESDLFQLLN